ncbi:hypothetical protein PV327_004420 [Microctonus hyperodae]|uniref:Cytochrome P450 n=1 Tax=Microctonus hyperodae TaxID=165561 RepID=A0AA39FCI0_MICHY|nr:hypothetical protein PV327_004420 [Microctonus hyperodae]
MAAITSHWILDSIILFASLIVFSYFYVTRKFGYWKKRGVTEFKPTPFIGNLGDCLTVKKSAGQWLEDCYNNSAGLPYVGLYLFHKPTLLVRDPELIKNVLVRDFNYFQDRYARASADDKLGSSNLFTIKNPAWKTLRSKITPIYTSGKVKKMFELMVEIGDDLDTHMKSLDLGKKGKVLELKEISAKFTTDMIATTAYGLRVNSLNNPDAEFRKHGYDIFRKTFYRSIELSCIFFLPEMVGPLGFKFFSKKSTHFLRNTMWEVLMERERSGIKRNDLIDLLVELRKSYLESSDKGHFEFDGDNLVAQAAIFFTGGFETSSSTLSFSLYELAINPEIQSKLRNEILEGLEQTNGKITYDLLMNLRYLDMVVAETLRKYPPLPFLDRVALADYKVPNSDFIIEKGTPVFISMTGLHYDPQYFPDPDKYDPERFSEENKKSRKPCVYIPFGEGPHNCIGMRIGLLQSKLGLVKLLTKYEFSSCKETQIPLRISPKILITASESGIFLNVNELVAAK